MKYFLDTEFLEGTQKKWFGETKPTLDLISIGIVAEDGREYYAISKDFNLKEAWNRYDLVKDGFRDCGMTPIYKKVYWIRENVLKPIYVDLKAKKQFDEGIGSPILMSKEGHIKFNKAIIRGQKCFTFKEFKKLIKKYGKTNKQIAEEVLDFINTNGTLIHKPYDNSQKNIVFSDIIEKYGKPKFYGYYCDYDWVLLCWLFGKMIDLPKGFPMFAFDIQQQIEEYKIDKEQLLKEVPQISCHNALQDAIWNKNAYNWIQKNKMNNGCKKSI